MQVKMSSNIKSSKFIKAINAVLSVSEVLLPQFNALLPTFIEDAPFIFIDILFISITDYIPVLGVVFSDLSDPIDASKTRYIKAVMEKANIPVIVLNGTESHADLVNKVREIYKGT